MWRYRRLRILCLAAALAGGCGDDDNPPGDDFDAGVDEQPDAGGGLPTAPPTEVRMVADDGFKSPSDAVASPDGETFYFSAFTTDDEPAAAVFSVDAAGGSPEVLHAGDPLHMVSGLVLSCDGETLYLADIGDDGGAVLSMSSGGGEPDALAITGLSVPAGLAVNAACDTLYVTGRNADGEGAVYKVGLDGGAAEVLLEGDPLVSPTGVYVDADNVAWVLDHLAGEGGTGVLFAIQDNGDVEEVIEHLVLGTPGGVSLTAGGGTAVIATRDGSTGAGQLTAVDIDSGEATVLDAPDIVNPAGLRTARGAGIFAVADSEGDAIFAAE